MAIPVTGIHILRLLLQVDHNLSGLQRDMRNNATSWKAMAQAQSAPVGTIAQFMNDAGAAYQNRLSWIDAAQANTPVWNALGAMWTKLGGTAQDFTDITTPLNAVATQLPTVPKTTYAQIISACDQILAAVDAPLSLWPE